MNKTIFALGFLIGACFTIIIGGLLFVNLQTDDTTTGQLNQPQNFLVAAATAAAKNAPGPDECPLPGEFERFLNEFADHLNESYDPTRGSHSQIRQLWRRYNPDSMLRLEGLELFDAIIPDYTRCTGQQPPHVERLPEDHVRHQCFYQDGDKVKSRQVIGLRQVNIMEICGLDAK